MKRKLVIAMGVATSAALVLSGCAQPGSEGGGEGTDNGSAVGETWDEIERLAAEEGKLELSVMSIPGFSKWAEYANEQLPTIDISITAMPPESLVARVITEQDNDTFLWDASVGALTNVYGGLHPDYLAPIDEILSDLPAEMLADDLWAGGFEHFSDPADHRSFINEYLLGSAIFVNRAAHSASDVSSPEDLLRPELKGKICINDPRVANQATLGLSWLLESEEYGEEYITELLTEQDVILTDQSNTTEWFATGRCTVALGPDARQVDELRDGGLDIDYEVLDEYGHFLLSWGVSVFPNAPHPNALRVFLAWFLSEDGQKSYVDLVRSDATTRLLSVEPGPAGPSKVDYSNLENYPVRPGTSAGAAAVLRMTTLADQLLSK